MNSFDLIYEKITPKKVKLKQHKPVIISVPDINFTGDSLKFILERLKYLKNFKAIQLHVIFDLGKTNFSDKITFLLLDIIFYDLFKTTRWMLDLKINVELCLGAFNSGIKTTAFYRTLEKPGAEFDRNTFIKEFEKFVTTEDTYRRYVTREKFEQKSTILSAISTDISTVLSQIYDDENWINEVCNVIDELIDNTYSHTESDCLIDINVCNVSDCESKNYKLLNIAVLNFSEDRIFDRIKNNIKEEKYSHTDEVYQNVYKAYQNHQQFFNEIYNEDDFFNVTVFQNGVTTRNLCSGTSGTGLTELIRNIVGKTKDSYSYVLSGENILFFGNKYLEIKDKHFVGFNEEADYISCRPDISVIERSRVYIPGTIFHLSLLRENYDG